MNFITWTIFATLRLSFAILSLHSLQEDRFDFAYSALNGRSSAILTKNGMEETGLTADWLELRANSFLMDMHVHKHKKNMILIYIKYAVLF